MDTTDRKLAWIAEQHEAGRTVYVTTATRSTAITPRTARRWREELGRAIVKRGARGELMLASGSRYVDASYAKLSAS